MNFQAITTLTLLEETDEQSLHLHIFDTATLFISFFRLFLFKKCIVVSCLTRHSKVLPDVFAKYSAKIIKKSHFERGQSNRKIDNVIFEKRSNRP